MKKSLIVILVLLSVLFAAVTVLNAQEESADTASAAETVGDPAAVTDESGMDGPSDAVGTEQPAADDPSDNNEENDQDKDQPEDPSDPAADTVSGDEAAAEEKKGMEVHIYGTQLSVEFSGEEKTAKGYRIEVTCGELEGKEKDACEAYGKNDFRYDGEAVAKGTAPDTYSMGLDPEKFVNENKDFEDVAFIVEEDGWIKITAKAEEPAAAEDPADDEGDENEKPAEDKDEDPAPAETPADENTISYGSLTVHLDPPAEDDKPAVNATDEEDTTTVDAEDPVVNTTDEEDTATVDAEEPVINTTDEEDTTTVDSEEPAVNTTDEEDTTTVDAEDPVVTTTNEEDTTTVDSEEPAVNTMDEEDTTTVDSEEPAVNTTDEEDTTTVDAEDPVVTTTDEEETMTVDAEEPAVTAADEEDTMTVDVEEDAVSVTLAENTATADGEEFEMTASDENGEALPEEGSEDAAATEDEEIAEEGPAPLTGIAKNGIEVRTDADGMSEILFTLEADTEVTVLAEDGDWLQILLPDGETQGWVLRSGIELPAAEDETEEEPAQLTGIAKTGINVRTDADGMSDILFTLEEDTEVTVVAVEGDWLLVLLPDGETQGWIFRTDIELTAEETEPAEVEPAENEPAEETAAPAEKKVTIFTSRRVQMEIGEDIVLTSLLEGFDDCKAIKYQWECDKGEGFEAVEGADSDSYTYPASEESMGWSFRLVVFYK